MDNASGPSNAQVPSTGDLSSSTAARIAATSPANAGATDCVPSPITNGGDAVAPSTVTASHDPPDPYACVERTIACSNPLFATASSASPFARR